MSRFHSLLRSRPASPKGHDRRSPRDARQAGRGLRLEALEDRFLPSASLVKDVNPLFFGSDPQNLTVMNGQAFLFADDGEKGHELWKTDGTAAGTVLVKDIYPGPGSSLFHVGITWHLPMVNINGTLFFSANDGAHGRELWKSDGTPNGTVMVKDINPGADFSFPNELANVNGTLFFFVSRGPSNTPELWKSDGTAAGTVFVKAFDGFWGNGGQRSTAVVGTIFYFTAQGTGQSGGMELWKSDGTTAGTVRVKDINPGAADSYPDFLTNVNGTLFFSASSGSGRELWKSNGTDAGTTLVKDIRPGAADGLDAFAKLTALGGVLYFVANDGVSGEELWRSDGTAAGTQVFTDLVTGAGDSSPRNLAVANGLIYFMTERTSPQRVWRTDGTVGGTVALSSGPSHLAGFDFTAVNGLVYFQGYTSAAGYELWRSDGTPNGTALVADINPRSDSRPQSLVNLNGTLLFTATDMSVFGNVGREVWRSNGTAASTVRVHRINPTPQSSDPSRLSVVNGTLYFLADEGLSPGLDIWRSDGSAARTQLLYTTSANPDSLIAVGGTVFFTVPAAANSHALLKITGPTALPDLVRTFSGGSVLTPGNMTAVGNRLFFTTTITPGNRFELWTSDGTTAGTYMVFSSTQPLLNLTNVNGTLFFSAADAASGRELYKSDGTAAGTGRVKDINPGAASSNPSALAEVGGYLWFSADDGVYGRELWVSDGSADYTYLFADLSPSGSSDPQNILAGFGSYPIFSADDGVSGREPWVCCFDGFTPTQIADIRPGLAGSDPQNLLTDAAGFLYMSADDGARGRELWFSDWTPAGTRLVKDIRPGPLGSDPQKLTLLYGYYLYFSADDGQSGRELWASDGSEEFTVLDTDIYPGLPSSNPEYLLELPDGYVYFAATGPDVGRELFRASPFFAGPGSAPGGAPGGGALSDLLADAAPAGAVVSPGAASADPRREVRPEAAPPLRAAGADLLLALRPKKERVERLFAQDLGVLDLLLE